MKPTPSIINVDTTDGVSVRHLRADKEVGVPDFALQGGMDKEEYIFLGCYAGYMILMYLLYWRDFMKPLKLLAVFVHEMGHAVAAWFTCGRVHSITVLADESGLAVYQPGLKIIIYPAGYVGVSLWGALLVTLSANRIGFHRSCRFDGPFLLCGTRLESKQTHRPIIDGLSVSYRCSCSGLTLSLEIVSVLRNTLLRCFVWILCREGYF
jgi:hypothetical protein